MRTIYKYPLEGRDVSRVLMPEDASIVHVGIQNGVFCVWALGDTEDPMVERSFTVVGTGWELDEFHIHLGTVFQDAFVWHIMEIA